VSKKILVVDDDDFMQEMFLEALQHNYSVIPAENGADALMMAQSERFDAIIMDVEMPGMNGYETCERLKQLEQMADIPVIFVSAHDGIEDRLMGYEAGGEDYISKPFDPQELEAKVAQLLKSVADRSDLKQMANYATSTAMTAITSMSEMGTLLETLKNFNACNDYPVLSKTALQGLALYGLQGAIQLRTQHEILTRNLQGEASPLEVSIINHLAGMERVTQFKSKLCINSACVSLLVHDMPMDDLERCGRLRDHLIMLVDGVEVRIQAIKAINESSQRGDAIAHAVLHITDTLKNIDTAQRQRKMETRLAFSKLIDKIEKALISVAMTETQERYVSDIVRDGIEEIILSETSEIDIQDKLTTIINELKGLLAAK
jgi:CheY-like chemotaxis protein